MKNYKNDEMQLLIKVLPFVRLPPEIRGHNICMEIVKEVREHLFEYFYNDLITENNPSSATARAEQMVDFCFESHTIR